MTDKSKLADAMAEIQTHPAWTDVKDPDREARLLVACEVFAHQYGVDYEVLVDAMKDIPAPAAPEEVA
jgi:hypothetical protein